MIAMYVADLLIVSMLVALGFAVGWMACVYSVHRQQKRSQDECHLTQNMLDDLRSVIDSVSSDVGRHGEYLAEVNDGLAIAVTGDSKQVASSLTKLVMANAKMRQRLHSAEARLKQQSHQIEMHADEARVDSLTQLVNRRAFDDEVKRCFAVYRRQNRKFSLVLIELLHDADKSSWNTKVSNLVVARAAAMIRDKAREMDLVARFGSCQFAIVLPGASLTDAVAVANRMRQELGRIESGDRPVQIHVGIVEVRPEDSTKSLIERAEATLNPSTEQTEHVEATHGQNNEMVETIAPVETKEETVETSMVGGESSENVMQAGSNEEPEWIDSPPAPVEEDEPPYLCARAEFRMMVARRLAEWNRGGVPLSAVLVRIDGYQTLVDEYGESMEPCMRSALWHMARSATRDMDLVGLYDQETFALLLPTAEQSSAVQVAERLRGAVVERSLTTPVGLLQFTVSCGVTSSIAGDNTDHFLNRADEALLTAVASGGDATYTHDGDSLKNCSAELESVAG